MKVFVYFNLHKKCWSVKALEGQRKGLVIGHTNELGLENATFKVSQAGRQRVLVEKRKNVHAGVVGTITECWRNRESCTIPVSYNPYKAGHFFNKVTNQAVHEASKVWLINRTVFTS